MALIRTIGLFWAAEDVFWGRGRAPGALSGVPADQLKANPIDFREQVGVYTLYAGYDLVYVGQTGGRGNRLLLVSCWIRSVEPWYGRTVRTWLQRLCTN